MLRSHRLSPERLLMMSLRIRRASTLNATTAGNAARIMAPNHLRSTISCSRSGGSSTLLPQHYLQKHPQHLEQPPPQCQPFRLFSTGTTGLVKEQSSTTAGNNTTTTTTSTKNSTEPTSCGLDKDGNVLVSAAKEAQRLSELAFKCRPTSSTATSTPDSRTRALPLSPSTTSTTKAATATTLKKPNVVVTEETLKHALEAAQALLIVTTKSTPLQDAIRNKQTADADIQRQISCLHRAFLAVTSWCLDVALVSHDPRILAMAIEVSRRAHQLQLPLHLPLYQRLMETVAQEYTPAAVTAGKSSKSKTKTTTTTTTTTSAGHLILEIASRASFCLGLQAVSSSHFFQESLVALARRGRYQDVVTVLRGMETQCNIFELELETLAYLLSVLNDKLEEHEQEQAHANSTNSNSEDSATTNIAMMRDWHETAYFYEILNLLNPYVWKTMSHYSALSEILQQQKTTVETKNEHDTIPNTKDDDTPSSTTATATENNAIDDNSARLPLLPTLPSYLKSENTESDNDNKPLTRRKRSSESYTKKDALFFYKEYIYQTDECSMHSGLPDVTEQIQALKGGTDFRYSEEFEQHILDRVMADDDDDSVAAVGERMADDAFFDGEEDSDGDLFFSSDDDDLDYFDEFSSDDDDDDDDDDDNDDTDVDGEI